MKIFVFFFSSRRRHTRCSRDWSSDVCSSDLLAKLDLDKMLEVYHALRGRKMCGTFGSAKGVPLKPPKDPDAKLWENVGSRSLVESLKNSDENARAILWAYHMGTPLPAGVS